MKYSGDVFIDQVLKECLESLKKTDSDIYLNESDFKFSFARAAYKCGAKEIILEYPIMTSDLYEFDDGAQTRFVKSYYKSQKCTKCATHGSCESMPCTQEKGITCSRCNRIEECPIIGCAGLKDKYNKDRTFIDVYFKYREKKYYVELKYKLLSVNTIINNRKRIERQEASVYRYKNLFKLGDQKAEDLGLYAIYEDIERMENIKRVQEDCLSFCILITNDRAYWNWASGLSEGVSLANERTRNENQVRYTGKRELNISNSYFIWKNDFKEITVAISDPNRIAENNLFRCLVINLNESDY